MAEGYVQGSAVRKSREYRNNRENYRQIEGNPYRHHGMSAGYLLFVAGVIITMVLVLTFYINLRSQVTGSIKHIAALESQLNTLKQDNDEAYSRANSNVDLEEIKRVAIQEYGMTYATEGQIVNYSDGGGNDYVHQVAPIPGSDK